MRRRVLEDAPYDRIAAELECSEAVVRQRVSRGLARLRKTSRRTRDDPDPELERELTAAIGRTTATAGRRRRAPILRGARGVVIAAVVLAVGTTVALAAGGVIPIGKPATPASLCQAESAPWDRHPGPGSERVLGLRTADPGGGPDWGMRIVRTNRGDACLQARGSSMAGWESSARTGCSATTDGSMPWPPGPGSPITCSAL